MVAAHHPTHLNSLRKPISSLTSQDALVPKAVIPYEAKPSNSLPFITQRLAKEVKIQDSLKDALQATKTRNVALQTKLSATQSDTMNLGSRNLNLSSPKLVDIAKLEFQRFQPSELPEMYFGRRHKLE